MRLQNAKGAHIENKKLEENEMDKFVVTVQKPETKTSGWKPVTVTIGRNTIYALIDAR